MKYFIINNTDNLMEIGHYPQIIKRPGYNPAVPNGYWNVRWDKKPNFMPNYESEIHTKAKATNFLEKSSGLYGFIIDEQFKVILTKHHLPDSNFYPVKVFHNENLLNYYWFHFINSSIEFIDFKSSIMEIFNTTPFKIIEEINIESINQINEISQSLSFEKGIRIKELVFRSNFPFYDVISLWNFAPIILISEKLKNALEGAEMTGYELKIYDKLIFLS